MALVTVVFGVPKGGFIIVAGAAILTVPIFLLCDLGEIGFHLKAQLQMANPTGVKDSVRKVIESDRCLAGLLGQTVDEHIAESRRRRCFGKIELLENQEYRKKHQGLLQQEVCLQWLGRSTMFRRGRSRCAPTGVGVLDMR